MKLVMVTVLSLLVVAVALSGEKQEKCQSTPAFNKIKSLAGTWKGKDEKGKSFTVSYTVVSEGSAVMEEMNMSDSKDAMITMYHDNGTSMMLTHYCSMGNQPRMQSHGLSKDGKTLKFSFVDVTNLSAPDGDCMTGLVVTFKDPEHFSQQWTMRMGGKIQPHETFEYERVKQ